MKGISIKAFTSIDHYTCRKCILKKHRSVQHTSNALTKWYWDNKFMHLPPKCKHNAWDIPVYIKRPLVMLNTFYQWSLEEFVLHVWAFHTYIVIFRFLIKSLEWLFKTTRILLTGNLCHCGHRTWHTDYLDDLILSAL
jgi:hypothetical protein